MQMTTKRTTTTHKRRRKWWPALLQRGVVVMVMWVLEVLRVRRLRRVVRVVRATQAKPRGPISRGWWKDITLSFFLGEDKSFDQYVHVHSNGLCVTGIAHHHPIFRDNKRVEQVTWAKATNIKCSGKKKKRW